MIQEKRRNRSPEHTLQRKIVTILKRRKVLFCASAGGMRTTLGTAIKMKQAGYIKGFPDIFVYEPTDKYLGLAIEVKDKTGQSDWQMEWEDALKERLYQYIIVKSIEQAEEEIDNYLKDRVIIGKILPFNIRKL